MKMKDMFPSNYLKADDLQGQAVRVKIANVRQDDFGGGEGLKNVLLFQGKSRGLVLNKTNANTIANGYGDETDNWTGLPLELFATETMFQGKMTPCIRLRIPVNGQQAAPATAPATATGAVAPMTESEIPF